MSDITKYDAACTAIAECHKLDEVKDWIDKADALIAYAKQANDTELERMSLGIKNRATIRLGELSAALESHQGINLPNVLGGGHSGEGKRKVLEKAKISKTKAHEEVKALYKNRILLK